MIGRWPGTRGVSRDRIPVDVEAAHDPFDSEKQRLSTRNAIRLAQSSRPHLSPEPSGPRWDPEHARENHDPAEPELSWLTGRKPNARGET